MAKMQLKPPKKFDKKAETKKLKLVTAEESKRLSGKVVEVLTASAFFIVLVLVVLFIFQPYLKPGFAGGYDTLIHFFKVAETKRILTQFGSYADWSDRWYNGYHQFLFYPPFFYVIATLADLVVDSLEITSKMMAVAGVLVAAVSSYLLTYILLPAADKPWRRSLAATGGAFIFALNPALLSFIVVRGKYPDYWAFALAPISFIFLFRWLKTDRNTIPLGFAVITALVFLAHLDTGVVVLISSFIFSFFFLKSSLGKRGRLFNRAFNRPLRLLGLSFIFFVGITTFFWLPYLAYIKQIGALEQLYPSRQPLPTAVYLPGRLVNGISRYPGILAVFFAGLSLVFKKLRTVGKPWTAVLITGVSLSLLTYTPVVSDFPAFNTLFYRSSVGITVLAISVLFGIAFYGILSWDWKAFLNGYISTKAVKYGAWLLPLILLIVTLSVSLFDYSFIWSGKYLVSKQNYTNELAQAVDFLRNAEQNDNSRVLVVAPPTAQYTFLPALIDKPLVNGYEAQASKTSVEVDVLISQRLAKKSERPSILAKFDRWNVQYLLVDSWKYRTELKNLLATKRFKPLFTGSRYQVLSYNPKGLVQPIRPVLIIGSGYDYAAKVLAGIPEIGLIKGGSKFVDNYSLKELKKYDLVLLYGFESFNIEDTEQKLLSYLGQGGKLIVAMDGSLSTLLPNDTFLGLTPVRKEFVRPTSKISGIIPIGGVSLSNRRSRWSGTYYSGPIKPWLIIDEKYPVIGSRKIGKGETLFVGYNLFYHAVYEKDEEEFELLQAATRKMINPAKMKIRQDVISANARRLRLNISNSKPAWALISMSWSPFWRAYVDNEAVPIYAVGNQTALYLPAGENKVELAYQNTLLYNLGLSTSLLTLLLALVVSMIRSHRRLKLVGLNFILSRFLAKNV